LQDSFYRSLNESELKQAAAKSYNFDIPEAFDQDLMMQCIEKLRVSK
jgi:uridine kinase